MNKRLRLMSISAALSVLPLLGWSLNATGLWRSALFADLAMFFTFAAVFITPTVVILSVAILWGLRNHWRQELPLVTLGIFNLLAAILTVGLLLH